MRSIRRITFTPVAASVASIAAISVLAIATQSASATLADARTSVFDAHGKRLGFIERGAVGWSVGRTTGCSIVQNGKSFTLSIGETMVGAGIRVSTRRFVVRATAQYASSWPLNGHRLAGHVIRHGRRRWDVLSRAAVAIGYTIGPDGPPAAVARLLLGPNLTTPRACS